MLYLLHLCWPRRGAGGILTHLVGLEKPQTGCEAATGRRLKDVGWERDRASGDSGGRSLASGVSSTGSCDAPEHTKARENRTGFPGFLFKPPGLFQQYHLLLNRTLRSCELVEVDPGTDLLIPTVLAVPA